MIFLILCLVPRVLSQVSLQHHVYVSRKSRSNSEPFETGYVYNQVNNDPATFSTFNSAADSRTSEPRSKPVLEMYSNKNYFPSTLQYTHPIDLSKQIVKTTSVTMPSLLPLRAINSLAKAESKYKADFLPSKIKTDAMYEQLKATMHYQPSHAETMTGYETEYHMDDDDVRTSSRGLYDSWPFYYHNPYEYEHMRIDAEREKAKDKRYAADAAKIIPIHEDLSHDIPNSHEPSFTTGYYRDTSTDNPLSGHEPFFSSLLNDYFNKKNDYEDVLTFKELDWGKDFDHEIKIADIDDYTKRNRRLPSHNNTPESKKNIGSNTVMKNEAVNGESSTEKGYAKKYKFDKHEKGDALKANDESRYNQNGQQHTAFKDFVDTFANKFGSEDHKKDSKYLLKRNQDKGENKKGFRRVYHKDEYQEDNEFYDNNNSSAKSEDKGSSNANVGGSEAFLASHAFANLGNQASGFDKSGKNENQKFSNNHKGHDDSYGLENHFNRFRDVARKAAQSNDADYSEHYRI